MKLKKSLLLTALTIVVALIATFICNSLIFSKHSLAVRSVNVDELGTLSYEEKADQLTERFESITTSEDEESYYFSGEIDIDSLDLLSTNYQGQEVKEKYSSTINKNDESIVMGKDVVIDGEVVASVEEKYLTRYDEANNKYYLVDDQGNEIDVLAELEDENVNECFGLLALISVLTIKQIVALCVVVAVATVIIVEGDTIAKGVNQLVEGVKDGFISFWDRIKLALGKITAVALNEIFYLTADIAIELYEVARTRKDCYILCETFTGKGFIPIKYKFTNYENARNWIKKGGSVWSPYSTTAIKCIEGAGYKAIIEKNKTTYVNIAERHAITFEVAGQTINYGFYHYHAGKKGSLKKVKNIHSFFGLPFGD